MINSKNFFPQYLSLNTLPRESADPHNSTFLDQEVVIDNWKIKLGDLILQISHLAFGILRLVSFSIKNALFKRKSKNVKEYCISQQLNNSCHLSPLLNLKILEKIRQSGYDLSKVDFRTRREWLGENQEMLISWNHLITQLCTEDAHKKYPNLYSYLTAGLEKGPILPYFYNQDQKFPFSGIGGAIEFAEMPFFLIDIEGLQKVRYPILCTQINFGEMISSEDLGLKTSIVNDRGTYKIYNSEKREFVPIEQLNWISIEEVQEKEKTKTVVKIDRQRMTDDEKAQYPLPQEGYEIVMRDLKALGFNQIGVATNLGGGLKFKNKDGEMHTYVPYKMSLLKILFLAAGIDDQNNKITRDHRHYAAMVELQELMSQDAKNEWHPERIHPDQFLQYQLAEIFKDNPDLFRKAKGVVDVFTNNWLNFKKVIKGEFYNEQGKQIAQQGTSDYLLGDEQAVAYYFMQAIRMAWYSSVNPKVVINSLEIGLPEGIAPMTHEYLVAKLKTKHGIKLKDGSISNESFLSVWDGILQTLKDRTKGRRTDFMSFDDHGWVVSLDETLIEMQNQEDVYDKTLLRRLGIAGIDSWWGSDLNLWYSKTRSKIQRLPIQKEMMNPLEKV